MSAFKEGSELGRDDLVLFVTGPGSPSDAFDVRWTVRSSSGLAVSGSRLRAVRAGVGRYYAPWVASTPGSYKVVWEFRHSAEADPTSVEQPFFVIPASECGKPIIPAPGGRAFISGQVLGRGDLPLFLKDAAGMPAAGERVAWTITDAKGFVAGHGMAANPAVGEYFVSWLVCGQVGDYVVTWDFASPGLPRQSARIGFSIVTPSQSSCPCPCPCQGSCRCPG